MNFKIGDIIRIKESGNHFNKVGRFLNFHDMDEKLCWVVVGDINGEITNNVGTYFYTKDIYNDILEKLKLI